MSNYIVSYTLKHNEISDTFEDRYVIFKDEEFQDNASKYAKKYADELLKSDGDKKDWHLWTIHVSRIIMSTDLF